MKLRAARAGDVAFLVEVTRRAYDQVFRPLLPDCDWSQFGESQLSERFAGSWQRVRIIEAAAPLGFAMITAGHLDMFFIAAPARGAGVGAILLADCERRGARSLECFAVNAGARRFYERHGWRLAARYGRLFAGIDCAFVRYEKP